MARALASTGRRILVLERGSVFARHADNWDPSVVWMEKRYRTKERWLAPRVAEFQPNAHYGVGGNTKFWGSVLYRLRAEDFEGTRHADGDSPRLAYPLRRSRAVLRPGRNSCTTSAAKRASIRPTRRGAPFPLAPVPHTAGMERMVDRLRAARSAPVARCRWA